MPLFDELNLSTVKQDDDVFVQNAANLLHYLKANNKILSPINGEDLIGGTDEDKAKLSEYHNLNLARFIRALSQQIPLVILDNTNIKKWEFIAYAEAAHALGYQVKEVVVGEIKDKAMQHLYYQRNIHKVPLKTINKMAYLFEW